MRGRAALDLMAVRLEHFLDLAGAGIVKGQSDMADFDRARHDQDLGKVKR
jgi:hypothetical protein